MSLPAFSSEDLISYCFSRSVNLREAEKSLSFLLLPREKVFHRPDDHCFDVLTSVDRAKLLEKFLSKRYTLVAPQDSLAVSLNEGAIEHCQLELKTIKEKKLETKKVSLGTVNNIGAESQTTKEVSVSEILLGLGKPGVLDLEGKTLSVECRKGAGSFYQLIFSLNEQKRKLVSSEVSLQKNQVLNVAQIIKDLNEKNQALGYPDSQYQESSGQEKIDYELQIK